MSQITSDPPKRSERHARTRRAPLALLIVPVLLIAIGVGVVFAVSGGDGPGGLLGGGGDDAEDVPAFDFRLSRTDVVSTIDSADVDALQTQAETFTAQEIAPVIDALYTHAFLDPANWRDGDYEEILTLFTDGSRPTAQRGLETITLGEGAGDVFETVSPRRGSLTFTVLYDPEGNPHTVAVRIRFFALGERQDGVYLSILSAGQMQLANVDGEWKIRAFDMRRMERETEPPAPAPSGGSTSPATTGATASTGGTG